MQEKGEEVADKAFDLNEKYSVCKSEQDYLKRKMKSDYSPKKMVLSEELDFPNLKKRCKRPVLIISH